MDLNKNVYSIYSLRGIVYVSEPVFVTRAYLEIEIALSQDQISKYADKILLYTNTCMKELRRLFLVQDLIDSLKVCLKLACCLLESLATPSQTAKQSGSMCIYCQTCRLQRLQNVMSVCVSVCCFDVAADLRGCSLQRPDTAHPR